MMRTRIAANRIRPPDSSAKANSAKATGSSRALRTYRSSNAAFSMNSPDKFGQVYLQLVIVHLLQKGDVGGSIDVRVGRRFLGFFFVPVPRQLVGRGQANPGTLGTQQFA